MRLPHIIIKSVVLLLLLGSCAEQRVAIKKNSIINPGELKVLSYNIHHANPPSEKEGLINVDAIASVIKSENPDLVALQEVDRFTKRSGNIDEAKMIAKKAGLYYRFFKAIDHDGGDYGLAILSRYPIGNAMRVALPQVFKGEARILSYVNIALPNKRDVVFANTHLDAQRSDSNRMVQMKRILAELNPKKVPVIICGDFNSEANKEAITLLDQQFKRSCMGDCPFTIPQLHPIKTIDYIAIRNANWEMKEHRVIEEIYASDHRPLVVTYIIK